MIGTACYWIFNMSIIASFMGLIVLAVRKIRVIPKRVSVFLWIIPFIRMWIPAGLNSRYSLMTLISKLTTKSVTVYKPSEKVEFSFMNSIQAAESYDPIKYKADILEKVFSIAGLIWLIGASAIIITLAVLYISTMREIKDASLLEGNVYLSEKVESPAVYGIFKPRIVLPASWKGKDLRYVTDHERTHIKRLDNLWRLLGFLTAAIHWFNPFSWVFLKTFMSDLECACDEKAVSGYSPEERKDYARVLLNASGSRNVFVSAFGGAKVRTRIENVLSYKQMTFVSGIGFAALVTVIIYVLLTNAG
ncbi:MAG: M56 family metallopeptidase [Clostridiales bacterium]|nr:M56 family metallopeptidase [Clostridiales bacterium]